MTYWYLKRLVINNKIQKALSKNQINLQNKLQKKKIFNNKCEYLVFDRDHKLYG